MFYDRARVYVQGGAGGNGCVCFRREKYVPRGGPDGGDGGRGGSIVLSGDEGLSTLADFRYRRHYRAERGRHGEGANRQGKSAPDLYLKVPLGTVIYDAETGDLLADIVASGQEYIVVQGGRGGRGNARFLSGKNRAPGFAEKGEPGEERWVNLELKLLADVGLVGLPNAGKSSLLARVTSARPKIADYPFTTLIPNLGVVDMGEGRNFVLADIPGLIEGAHAGAGLGHTFLRHVERTRLLVHVLDISVEKEKVLRNLAQINQEIRLYSPELAQRPRVIAANKVDLPAARENFLALKPVLAESEREIWPVSAATGQGVRGFVNRIYEILATLEPPAAPALTLESPRQAVAISNSAVAARERLFTVEQEGERTFRVKGRAVERLVVMTDLENEEAVMRLQHLLARSGVDEALRRAGVRSGDTVRIDKWEFEYWE